MRHSFLFKILVLLIISVCVCPDSHAQIRQERQKPDQIGGGGHQGPIKPPKSGSSKPSPRPSKDNKSRKRTSETRHSRARGKKGDKTKTGRDKPSEGVFVYYGDAVKLNGWLVGVGEPLTQDQARQLDTYFKFSQQNAAGHWCFVEAFKKQGYINCDHVIHPYMDLYDDSDEDWFEIMDSICKWEFVADASGDTVVEERSLAADSSAVFIFHPIQVADREVLGIYTDRAGTLLSSWDYEEEDATDGARFVHIVRDEYGFDVVIDVYDAVDIPDTYLDAANKLLETLCNDSP